MTIPPDQFAFEQLRAECERLREKVKQLERQHALDEESLTMAQLQRDGLLEILKMLPADALTADWEKLLRENGAKSLDEFLPELEQLVN